MLADIQAEVAFTRRMIGRDALDPRVMDAMRRVPREQFVPVHLRPAAFSNGPLPIGRGQTISQPYIVALMTDLAAPQPNSVVLEVGTGCGYQAAVLSLLAERVYSIEIVPELAEAAAQRLQRLGYTNVEVRAGDAWNGWSEQAPFDAIVVTAAAIQVPPPLLAQLAPGGRLVIPLGPPYGYQELCLLEKNSAGAVTHRQVLGVAFVPLTGGHSASSELD
jgi:protein-L-isoaspartate(D-aspartate) O-methyltransferase